MQSYPALSLVLLCDQRFLCSSFFGAPFDPGKPHQVRRRGPLIWAVRFGGVLEAYVAHNAPTWDAQLASMAMREVLPEAPPANPAIVHA